jgi:hypothetical protein
MARAKLFYNDDGTQFGFVAPDGSEFELDAVPDEGVTIVEDPDNGNMLLIALSNYEGEDLEPNTIYQLIECETELDGEDEEEEDLDPTLADAASE